MKGLKQTRLSFAPVAKGETPTRNGQSATTSTPVVSTESPARTPRPKRSTQAPSGRGRGAALAHVEIPNPPKRSSRIRASPAKPNAKASGSSPVQARKPSLKRKASSAALPYAERPQENAGLPDALVSPSIVDDEQKGSPRPSLPKKIRLSSPESDLTPLTSSSGFEVDPDELVPTSQSDEQELTLPRIPERDPNVIKESVAKWRKDTHANPPSRTQSPPPLDPICTSFDDAPMDVDAVPEQALREDPPTRSLPYPQTPRSSSGGSSHLQHLDAALNTVTRKSALVTPISPAATPTRVVSNVIGSPSDAFSSLTPPPSSDSISGPEPEEEHQVIPALDSKSKTDQLIADIKARAYAAAHSSPEQSPLNLDSLSDSDSDSDSSDSGGGFAMFSKGAQGKGKGKATDTPSKAGPSGSQPPSAPRYNLRRASPSRATKPAAPVLTQQRKPSKANPLDSLLREKARDERTGMGMVAIRSAEAAFAAAKEKEGAKKSLKEEMADEEGSDSDDDWRTAIGLLGSASGGAKKAQNTRRRASKARSEDADASEDEEAADADSEGILKSKAGKAVDQILENDIRDEKARALAKLNAEPIGVPLWTASAAPSDADESMDEDSIMPPFSINTASNAVLQLLANATLSNDILQISALLSSGLVTVLTPDHYKSVVPWLFDLVFSDVPASLSGLAYTQLMRLAPLLQAHPSGLQPSSIHSALVRLGATPAILETLGWNVSSQRASQFAAHADRRDQMVYRLVTLLGVFAQAPQSEGLPDYFFATLLIGMDPSTSDDLLVEIHKTCDAIGHAIEEAQSGSFDLEASLYEMVVRFGKPLSPINQARLVSLFPCISPSTTRMARNVSRALLMGTPTSTRGYEKLPDLLPVVDLLSPDIGSGGHFDVAGNGDREGYYEGLASRVSLLSRVLSSIDEYTALEVQAAKEKAAKAKAQPVQEGEEKKEKEKEKEEQSIIQQIRMQLELLHGRIVDTRAAHLDRSRAKAAIQQLSSRVHYQRVATLKSGSRGGKPRTINTFFSTPS